MIRRGGAILDEDLRRGEYHQWRRGVGWGDLGLAVMRCPSCGMLSYLPRDHHHVDVDGVVVPRLQCPGADCNWSADDAVLEGWVPEPVGSA